MVISCLMFAGVWGQTGKQKIYIADRTTQLNDKDCFLIKKKKKETPLTYCDSIEDVYRGGD